ncbi:hypothetical protein Tco_0767219 [Tanacetum coccineum]
MLRSLSSSSSVPSMTFLLEYEHVVYEFDFAGNEATTTVVLKPENGRVSNKQMICFVIHLGTLVALNLPVTTGYIILADRLYGSYWSSLLLVVATGRLWCSYWLYILIRSGDYELLLVISFLLVCVSLDWSMRILSRCHVVSARHKTQWRKIPLLHQIRYTEFSSAVIATWSLLSS